MNPKKRLVDLYLSDIMTSMNRIEVYIGEITFDEFRETSLIVDAVIRNFEIIGEASKNIPREIRERNPELPWGKMYGLRNLVSHAYFGIDYEMIWEIVKQDLPKNKEDLKTIIEKEKNHGR